MATKKGKTMLTTSQVASILGVTPGRVRQFVVCGRLPVEWKVGMNLLFNPQQVAAFARKKRLPGRPRKK